MKHAARMDLEITRIPNFAPVMHVTPESIAISFVLGVKMLRVSTRNVCVDLKDGEVICVTYQDVLEQII